MFAMILAKCQLHNDSQFQDWTFYFSSMLSAPHILLSLLVYSSKSGYRRKKALSSIPASSFFPNLVTNASTLCQN